MGKFLLRRVLLGLLTLLLVSIVVFAATQALPGNAARAILGRNATPARIAALTQQLHLDRSVFSQYFSWLGGVVHGNFGTSAATQAPVSHLISGRILDTAFLVLVSGIIAIPLSRSFASSAACAALSLTCRSRVSSGLTACTSSAGEVPLAAASEIES